jgi:hypothetical protein
MRCLGPLLTAASIARSKRVHSSLSDLSFEVFTMSDSGGKILVSKMDVARRQLQTAIQLWFTDGDPISIHTLAAAAYEIIHAISKKRNPNRRDLLFDSLIVKEEYRGIWAKIIKEPANFFKHAKRDIEDTTVFEYNPKLVEGFFLFSLLGVHLCGERHNAEENCYMQYLYLHEPKYLTDKGRELFVDQFPIHLLDQIRAAPKKEFFETVVRLTSKSEDEDAGAPASDEGRAPSLTLASTMSR